MTEYFLPVGMIICLSLTIAIETFIALLFKIKNIKDFINITLANLITNPLVVSICFYFNIYHGLLISNIIMAILEIIAILVEGFIYKKYLKFDKINPYVLSLILNLTSYVIGGLLINNIIK